MPSRMSRHGNLSAAAAYHCSDDSAAPYCIMSIIVVGWPVSSLSRCLNSSARSSISLTALASTACRSSGDIRGHGPSSNALRAAATAASTSALAASGTLPTYSPVAGERTSMTSDDDGWTHLPPMKSLSHSVLYAVCVMALTLPSETPNENLFQLTISGGLKTSTRLLTRNSRTTGARVSHQPHFGW